MPSAEGWFDRFVNGLPETRIFQRLASWVLVPYWAWRTPVKPLPGGPHPSIQPGDNLQCMMNLIMPLKEKSPIGRAKAALAIAQNKDAIYAGLDNVGTVHFARFVIVGDNICMFSVYDGDFTNYIRDFIATIGSVFNAVVELVEGGEAVIPCEHNVEAFIQWVHERDLYQVPDTATDLLRDQEALNGDKAASGNDDLRLLPRKVVLQLRANANVSLGGGYRAYPGFSAAQVRNQLGLGW
ncbi:hypothetical protein [Bradyrhizobium neotropicale]|uniref:hypothetical protein n=1 Tax=Bradyrhizobium neotropicale TaxID=1497615 RepID=UPI001AD6E48E|nr:hypothetical protein [Bradyrhizobium neotropicale]MBO4226430.1 hypothetical protein [Bradyrhizobium neotropicale]